MHALQCMIELVTVCSRLGLHLPYVMTAVASILAQGPRRALIYFPGKARCRKYSLTQWVLSES